MGTVLATLCYVSRESVVRIHHGSFSLSSSCSEEAIWELCFRRCPKLSFAPTHHSPETAGLLSAPGFEDSLARLIRPWYTRYKTTARRRSTSHREMHRRTASVEGRPCASSRGMQEGLGIWVVGNTRQETSPSVNLRNCISRLVHWKHRRPRTNFGDQTDIGGGVRVRREADVRR